MKISNAILLASSLAMGSLVSSEDLCEEPVSYDNECIVVDDYCCPRFYWEPHIAYRGGDGRSYDWGYQSLGFFTAFSSNLYDSYFFLDVRANRIDNGRFGSNLGLGWRSFYCDFAEMIGINAYWDVRRRLGFNYQQIGVGLELFSSILDVRMNGYIPVGSRKALQNTDFFDLGGGNFTIRRQYQVAMWGLDIEVAKCFNICDCLYLDIGAGPYFYDTSKTRACQSGIIGGMGRVSLQLYDYVNLEFFITHDCLFGTKPQGEITISIPFSCIDKCWRCLFPKVRRNPVIITNRACQFLSNF